jgi:radical SAM-linked protein
LSVIRIRFEKKDDIKFISHLDMMNCFQRAVRRADLEAEYSHGFNPQMHMVFSTPLSLGFASEAEYADLSFTIDYEAAYVMQKLNEATPEGINITGAGVREGKVNIMADIASAEYEFRYSGGIAAEEAAKAVVESKKLTTEKVRKGRTRIVDVRPLIFDIKAKDDKIGMLVKAGNSGNLNPRILVEAIAWNLDPDAVGDMYRRTAQYVQRDGEMLTPLDEEVLRG